MLKLASIGNIKKDKALEIIHQVLYAIQKWDAVASEVAVSSVQTQNIREALSAVHKNAHL